MRRQATSRSGEDGYMLLGAIVAIFLVLLALSVAAPVVAKNLRRDREVETVRRGNQYVRAIQLYQRKFPGAYPPSMDALEKSNNIRFLRQRYIDPLTGKSDWRMIKVGENKTTVKGFFGKPLAGLPGAGLGSAAGMASPGAIGAGAAGPGGTSSFGSSSFGSSSTPAAGASAAGATTTTDGTSGASGTSGSGTGTPGSSNGLGSLNTSSIGGAFMGVGVPKTGTSVMTLNEQMTYQTWEFLYDPRVELLKAQASLLGGPASTGAGSLGSASGLASPTNGNGTNGTGTGFGSGFGTTPSTGTGTTPTNGNGTAPPPQQ